MRVFRYFALAAALLAGAQAAEAGVALTLDETSGVQLGNGPFTLGWSFELLSPMSVTALGAFDSEQDGLAQDHEVGIWDSLGNLVVSATVTGTDALVNQFRYRSVAAVDLAPGVYNIGAVWLDGVDPLVLNGTNIATAPWLTYIGGQYIPGASLSNPTSSFGTDGYFGPNFQAVPTATAVPEPSTFALAGLAGIGGLVALVRRRNAVAA